MAIVDSNDWKSPYVATVKVLLVILVRALKTCQLMDSEFIGRGCHWIETHCSCCRQHVIVATSVTSSTLAFNKLYCESHHQYQTTHPDHLITTAWTITHSTLILRSYFIHVYLFYLNPHLSYLTNSYLLQFTTHCFRTHQTITTNVSIIMKATYF